MWNYKQLANVFNIWLDFCKQNAFGNFYCIVQGLGGYEKMPSRNVELGNAAAGVPGCLGDIYEEFEKEDMSEMFRRAFLEQMDAGDDNNR